MSATEPNGPGSSTMKAKASTGTRGSFSGLPEYQLNLDVSLLLKDILEQRGYQVIMTRTDNDTAISNKERAELVASQGAEICVRKTRINFSLDFFFSIAFSYISFNVKLTVHSPL